MKMLFTPLLCFGLALSAAAQPLISETEEQYARSQAARGEGIAAFRAGDFAAALEAMKRALKDRPNNAALLSNAIYLAAEAGDLDALREYAGHYAMLGLAPGGAVTEKMQQLLEPTEWQAFDARFQQNVASQGSGETLLTVPTEHRLVEGIAYAPDHGYFLSTVVSGRILKTNAGAAPRVLVDGKDHSAGSFFGIAFSPDENALYATFGRVDQTPGIAEGEGQTGVMRINPVTGEVTGTWALPGGTEGQQIADVTAHKSGVYVTDGQSGKIYRIEGDALVAVPTAVSIRSAQGITVIPDGMLMVADYGRGLWRIDPSSGDALLLPVPQEVSLIGLDGLFLHDGRLLAIQNGVQPHRLIEISLATDASHVTGVKTLVQALAAFDEPTLGTSSPLGPVIVASSQWPKFGEGGAVRDGATVAPTTILLVRD